MSRTMTTNILPHDVVIDILSRLPVKSLLRFRCVSKPWKIFFSDPSFINMHLKHSINNYEHIMLTGGSSYIKMHLNHSNNNHQQSSSLAANDDEIVEQVDDYPFNATYGCNILGSCNGLILITFFDDDVYYIWNPSTKEFKKLPDTSIDFQNKGYNRGVVNSEYGFGYDKIIEDYKVVRIEAFDDYSSEVQVYTLGSDSWRRIRDIPGSLALDYRRTAGNLVNGVLHWIVERKFVTRTSYSLKVNNVSRIILSFDIEDEKYGEIPQPDFIDTKFHMNVEVLGGCLCILCDFDHIYSDIWVMKEYGVKESWTKLFTIPCSGGSLRPIKFTKNGEVLFVKHSSSLFMYDPKDGSAKTLQIRGLKDWLGIDIYVESLISLNSGTFVGQEQNLISLNSGTFVGQEQAACKRSLKNRKKKDKRKNKNR